MRRKPVYTSLLGVTARGASAIGSVRTGVASMYHARDYAILMLEAYS